MTNIPTMVPLKELSQTLKVSILTLRNAIEKDGLPAYKICGQWRVVEEEVIAWLKSKKNQPKQEVRRGERD